MLQYSTIWFLHRDKNVPRKTEISFTVLAQLILMYSTRGRWKLVEHSISSYSLYQHKAAPHWSCSEVLPCAPKALMECSMGLSWCHGTATAPELPICVPRALSVPITVQLDPRPRPSRLVCHSSDHAGTILSPSITCTETILHTFIGKADL